LKRVFDILFAIIALLLFLPLSIPISLWIILESKGGLFFRQERVGQWGKSFFILKFRTMYVDAEKYGSLTVGMRDNRITRSGYYLRKYKLDEFPQFINVLKGEMSVVGPRPEVKEFVELYTADQLEILKLKPGITDYASIAYYEENKLLASAEDPKKTYIEDIMPAKLSLNKKYKNEANIVTDLLIVGKTFFKFFR
jgi:lipopolysaccharide/colanic/teichoic acid biosynthesis glycosyltransferase